MFVLKGFLVSKHRLCVHCTRPLNVCATARFQFSLHLCYLRIDTIICRKKSMFNLHFTSSLVHSTLFAERMYGYTSKASNIIGFIRTKN